jgi:hypothetical protein
LLGPERSASVTVLDLPRQPVVAASAVVDHGGALAWYDDAVAVLASAMGDAAPLGPLAGRYDHELFTNGRGSAVLYRPVLPAVAAETLPARRLAVVTHHGPHHDIDLSYATLGTWVRVEGIGAPGPVEEIYDVGPIDDPDPATWRTRVGWPVH